MNPREKNGRYCRSVWKAYAPLMRSGPCGNSRGVRDAQEEQRKAKRPGEIQRNSYRLFCRTIQSHHDADQSSWNARMRWLDACNDYSPWSSQLQRISRKYKLPPSLPIRSRSLGWKICACSIRGRQRFTSAPDLLSMSSKMSSTSWFARSPMA
jgi:hypothetical protein